MTTWTVTQNLIGLDRDLWNRRGYEEGFLQKDYVFLQETRINVIVNKQTYIVFIIEGLDGYCPIDVRRDFRKIWRRYKQLIIDAHVYDEIFTWHRNPPSCLIIVVQKARCPKR